MAGGRGARSVRIGERRPMSEISVNGQPRGYVGGTTVTDVVLSLTGDPHGCAVAVNDAVVPRSDWDRRLIDPGDRVEVLTAAQGG
jgi:sulfur carrier protein